MPIFHAEQNHQFCESLLGLVESGDFIGQIGVKPVVTSEHCHQHHVNQNIDIFSYWVGSVCYHA